MKNIVVYLLFLSFSVAVFGLNGNEGIGEPQEIVNRQQLVGVWQTADLAEALGDDLALAVEMYFTGDGNLYLLFTYWTTAGHRTDIYHYTYGVTGNMLELTLHSVPGNVREDWPEFAILVYDDARIILDVSNTALSSWASAPDKFTLIKVSDDVPYGWTDAQIQEMIETNQRIDQEIYACAERFGEALGLSVLPHNGGIFWEGYIEHGIEFMIDEDTPVLIAFIGSTLTPASAERYAGRFIDGREYRGFPYVENDAFALYYVRYGDPVMEDMLDVFVALFD